MRPSELLREAALLIASGDQQYGCIAIEAAIRDRSGRSFYDWSSYEISVFSSAKHYFGLFRPFAAPVFWFMDASQIENQLNRFDALNLAAEIAESEGV